MDPSNAQRIFPVFMGVWIALGLSALAFFGMNKNAALKRQVFPLFSVGMSVLFVGFGYWMGIHPTMLLIIVPVVAVITFLNLRRVQFCDSCGATLMNQNLFSKPEFCSKCGAALGTG